MPVQHDVRRLVRLRLDDVQSSRRLTARGRVDENHCVVSIKHRISQIDAADSEIDDAHFLRKRSPRQAPGHFATEGVVRHEKIADAGDQYSRSAHIAASTWSSGTTSSTPKKKRWPGCPVRPKSLPGSSSTVTAT